MQEYLQFAPWIFLVVTIPLYGITVVHVQNVSTNSVPQFFCLSVSVSVCVCVCLSLSLSHTHTLSLSSSPSIYLIIFFYFSSINLSIYSYVLYLSLCLCLYLFIWVFETCASKMCKRPQPYIHFLRRIICNLK